MAIGGGGSDYCIVNQLPPDDAAVLPPDLTDDDPHAGFALNGYLRLMEFQNQALRKLAAHLEAPVPPLVPPLVPRDTSPGPADESP